jgi:hypothetical protein
VIDDIPKHVGAKTNVQRYSDRTYLETGVIAHHYFKAVWQQKCNSISWVDPSLQQGSRQVLSAAKQVSIRASFILKNQSRFERKLFRYVIQ